MVNFQFILYLRFSKLDHFKQRAFLSAILFTGNIYISRQYDMFNGDTGRLR